VIPKSSEVSSNIKGSLSRNILFKHLDEEQLEKVVEVMFEKKIKVSEIVIQQGMHILFRSSP
jgi:hypothetical protein